MTRARESDGVEEEEKEPSTKMASSFKIIEDLFLNWDGPDIVSESVEDWIRDFAGHSGKSTVGNFFQYCLSALSENFEEDFELTLWMMNLVAHYVADNESWLDTADELKNWGNLFLSEEDWEVPPPLWAITREKNSEEYRSWVEEEKLKELKEKKAEESLVTTSPVDLELKELKEEKKNEEAEESSVTSSPLDLDWGKELPAPIPSVAAPSTPMWRPWEENISFVNLSAVQKRKRKSPAAAARSRRRLQMWQEKKEMARLTPELRTTPKKFAQQMRRTNLLTRMEGHRIDCGGSNVEALVEGEVESSVFFSNLTKTSLLPQLTKSSPKIITPHQRSSPTICQSCSKRMQ